MQEDVAEEHSALGALADRKAVDVGEQGGARVASLGSRFQRSSLASTRATVARSDESGWVSK